MEILYIIGPNQEQTVDPAIPVQPSNQLSYSTQASSQFNYMNLRLELYNLTCWLLWLGWLERRNMATTQEYSFSNPSCRHYVQIFAKNGPQN